MNILVTGASRGIGYELVKIFGSLPDVKVIAVSRSTAKLQELARSLPGIVPVSCDLSAKGAVAALLAESEKHIGQLDILVNNAGAIVNKDFSELDTEDFARVYAINVFAVAAVIKGFLPLLGKSRKAHVVNISSMGGVQGSAKFSGLSAYSSSKAALAGLTECLAEEYKDSTVSFNCLALGAVQTEMLEEAFPGYIAPVSAAEMAEFIANFSQTAHFQMNGKIVPVSKSTP
jgi:3-oxoacyl-[acyl-carrier protein] reductase